MTAEVADAIFRKGEGMSDDKDRGERAEAFEAWRTHHVTCLVMEALCRKAEICKERWLETSFHAGNCDERLRADLHARFEVVSDLVSMTFEDLEEALAEPERD